MPPWENVQKKEQVCKQCGSTFLKKRTSKYCSLSCVYKARYGRHGQRLTPEQRSFYYKKRTEKPGYSERLNEQNRVRREKLLKFVRDFKTKEGCCDCGYREHHAALEFDHVRGEKELNISFAKSIAQAKKEIKKCEVVCANCHRIRTYERLQSLRKPDIFAQTYDEVAS